MSDAGLDPNALIADLAKALCYGRVRNHAIFLATGVTYPNGVGVTVRIEEGKLGFWVTDDGYASTIAESMGVVPALARVAPGVAKRAGLAYERGQFQGIDVAKGALPAAVAQVANASARAIERVLVSLEQPRLRKPREVFDNRLRAAFGDQIVFDLEISGATGRKWQFNAGLQQDGLITRLFELVSPTTQSVALANMKIIDTKALTESPLVTAALADYDATEPALRSILSNAGSVVIAANDDVARYKVTAA